MNCQDVRDTLRTNAGPEKNLSDDIRNHLRGCGHCDGEWAFAQHLKEAWPKQEPRPESYWDGYNRAILDKLEKRTAQPAWTLRWVPAFALSMALVITVSFYQIKKNLESNRTQKEMVTDLDLLENLPVLEQEDFDQLALPEGTL